MVDQEGPRLAAILLAAGGSSRLGQPKQLVTRNGESLVRRAAGLLLDMGADPVVVVTGCRSEEVAAELQDLSVGIIHNDAWEAGMGHSIACGAREIPESVDGVMLVLCDQWKLRKKDLRALLDSWNSDISQIIVSEWKDKYYYISGPPVIFPGKLIPELKCVKGNEGARVIIGLNSAIVRRVAVQNAVFDLDSPQDLEQLENV